MKMKYTTSLFAVLVIGVLSAVGVNAVVDTIAVKDSNTAEVKVMFWLILTCVTSVAVLTDIDELYKEKADKDKLQKK